VSLNYTTVEHIWNQLPMLEETSIVSSLQVASFAQDAEAEIDGLLAQRYTVPVAGAPPLLRTAATKLTLGLILSQNVFTQERVNSSEWPEAFISNAKRIMKGLVDGKYLLVSSAGTLIDTRNDLTEVWSNNMTYHSTKTELDPTREFIDEDKTTALEDERELTVWPGSVVR